MTSVSPDVDDDEPMTKKMKRLSVGDKERSNSNSGTGATGAKSCIRRRYGVTMKFDAINRQRATGEPVEELYKRLLEQAGCPASLLEAHFPWLFFAKLTEDEAQKFKEMDCVVDVAPETVVG